MAVSTETKPSAAELASARRLFQQAILAEDREQWAEALQLYQRVRRVAVSPSVHYHTAVCHEALGQLVEAVNAFELAISSAQARGEVALVKDARARLEKLRAQTPQVTITVPEGVEGLRIEIDGQPINPALAGTAVMINPGERRFSVRAENRARAYEATLRVSPGEALEVRADLGSRKAPPALRPASIRPRPASAPAPEDPRSLVPGFVAGGAALALAAGAVATGVAGYNVREDYIQQNKSPAPGSLDEREALRDRGQALAITSTALTGGALIAAGLATYLFWPSSSPSSTPSARVSPWMGASGAGIGVGGAL